MTLWFSKEGSYVPLCKCALSLLLSQSMGLGKRKAGMLEGSAGHEKRDPERQLSSVEACGRRGMSQEAAAQCPATYLGYENVAICRRERAEFPSLKALALRMASDRRHIACNRFCKIAQEIFKQDKKHPDMPYFKNEADLWEIDMAKAAILLEGNRYHKKGRSPHANKTWRKALVAYLGNPNPTTDDLIGIPMTSTELAFLEIVMELKVLAGANTLPAHITKDGVRAAVSDIYATRVAEIEAAHSKYYL